MRIPSSNTGGQTHREDNRREWKNNHKVRLVAVQELPVTVELRLFRFPRSKMTFETK